MLETTPEVTTEPPLGETAHDKAMIAKSEAAAGNTPAVATRPDHIPEKFWDAEKGVAKVDELAKSYAELEKGRSVPKEPAPAQPIADATAAAEAAAKAAGGDTSKVDFGALSNEYAERGELSAEAYTKLEAAGLTKELVDQYIEGQKALGDASLSQAYSLAGSQEQYTTMLDWATQNLSTAEQAAYDRAVVSDPATRKQAIIALKAQYAEAVGKTPALLRASGPSQSSMGGQYASRAEVTADMKDPRYKSDSAYRDSVQRKLANSSVF